MTEPCVECVALAVEIAGRRIVDGVSLRAEPGQVVAVVGPNGAGKTTLLRALAGLVASTGGLRVAGEDPRAAPAGAAARRRAYCAQQPVSAWDYRVRDLGEIAQAAAFADRLAELGLAELADRRLSRLSGGERKAAHLAMTLAAVGEPYGALLVLDEPTASLDLARQALVAAAIRGFVRAGGAAVVATHDLAYARACETVVVLAEGRAVGLGAPPAALTPVVVAATWGAAVPAGA
ncbi:MAG: ATP-binding cassette domain-containing protein [Verrucomicrobia bacterium]|nr:ATP-binding cassette domain-containing protein [Verrucomicrobiota bacterium]